MFTLGGIGSLLNSDRLGTANGLSNTAGFTKSDLTNFRIPFPLGFGPIINHIDFHSLIGCYELHLVSIVAFFLIFSSTVVGRFKLLKQNVAIFINTIFVY